MKTLPYTERINKLCLSTLELRRLHIDLLYCYKILFGRVDLCCEDFVNVCVSSVTRGHKYKLYKQSCSKSVRSQFFVNPVINVLNNLPQDTDFSSFNLFKCVIENMDLSQYLKYNQ